MDTSVFKVFLCFLELVPVPRWFVTSGTLSQHLKSTKRTPRHDIMESIQSGVVFFNGFVDFLKLDNDVDIFFMDC